MLILLAAKDSSKLFLFVFSFWLVRPLAFQIIGYVENVKFRPSVTITNKVFSNIQKSFCIAWLRIQHLVGTYGTATSYLDRTTK